MTKIKLIIDKESAHHEMSFEVPEKVVKYLLHILTEWEEIFLFTKKELEEQ